MKITYREMATGKTVERTFLTKAAAAHWIGTIGKMVAEDIKVQFQTEMAVA